jgi:hypothetical protein
MMMMMMIIIIIIIIRAQGVWEIGRAWCRERVWC